MSRQLKRDSVWKGLVIGLLLPVAVYGVLRLLYEFLDAMGVFSDVGFAEDFRTRTIALIAICSNLILMQVYRKSHQHHETIRGMLVASMILVAIWFFVFGLKILQS
jgi:hypothetical protein